MCESPGRPGRRGGPPAASFGLRPGLEAHGLPGAAEPPAPGRPAPRCPGRRGLGLPVADGPGQEPSSPRGSIRPRRTGTARRLVSRPTYTESGSASRGSTRTAARSGIRPGPAFRPALSVKLEAGAGIVLDALYTLDPSAESRLEGLQASLGADYSLFGGDLYVLGQYLYNGPGALAPGDEPRRSLRFSGTLVRNSARRPRSGCRRHACRTQPQELHLRGSPVPYRRLYAGLSVLRRQSGRRFFPSRADRGTRALPGPDAGLVLPRSPGRPQLLRSSGGYGELGPANSGSWASLTFTAKLKF